MIHLMSGRTHRSAVKPFGEASGSAPSPAGVATSETISPSAAHLLKVAGRFDAQAPSVGDAADGVAELKTLFLSWVIYERTEPASTELRRAKSELLLYAMAGAATLYDALVILVRFAGVVWTTRGPAELREEANTVAVIYRDAPRPGAEGLMHSLWPLSLTVNMLEFLASETLPGVTGQVPNPPDLPESTAALLFDRPLTYEAPELALLLPRRQLSHPVVAPSSSTPAFFDDYLTMGVKPSVAMRSLVAGLIRDDLVRHAGRRSDLSGVAEKLGCSTMMLRRRLDAEGTSFRAIKDAVVDELAKGWLVGSARTMNEIAEHLDYSDSFSFRRAFRRRNGISPHDFRRQEAAPKA